MPPTAASLDDPHGRASEEHNLFAIEMGRLFRSSWCYGLHSGRLRPAGRQICLRVGGREVVFVAREDGAGSAFPNICLHKGERLLEPDSTERAALIRCVHHGWYYDLDGRLMGGPGFDLASRARRPSLPCIPTVAVDGHVLAGPGTGSGGTVAAPSLGGILVASQLVDSADVEVGLGWKAATASVLRRGWSLVLPNLAVARRDGWQLLLRMEPLAAARTGLSLERCATGSAGSSPAAPELMRNLADSMIGARDGHAARADLTRAATFEEVERRVTALIGEGRAYLFSEG